MKNNGGQAFPGEQGHISGGTWNQTWDSGMSLRQWYVGQIIQGFAPTVGRDIGDSFDNRGEREARDWWAEQAVLLADAVLRIESMKR